jgi:cardiolipin synthase
MMIFNLSQFNIPSDKNNYKQMQAYFSESQDQFNLAAYEQNDIGIGMTTYNNDIRLLPESEPAFNILITEMENATKNLNIGLFIIRNDDAGNRFKNVLIDKAHQGLEVRLLYDAWGSAFTPMSFFNDLRAAGVKVAAYNPLWSGFIQGRLDNRLHRKTIIIDGKLAFIGGENIGNEYLGKSKKTGYWKDTGIIFYGDASRSVQEIFLNDWYQASHENVANDDFYPRNDGISAKTVTILPGGPDSPLTKMNVVQTNLITKAQDKIFIATPYFFPDVSVLKALYGAAARGIDVNIIIPSHGDSKLGAVANYFYMKKLLNHGIKVSTYNKGFIHSKVIIIDDNIASVGSANLEKFSEMKNYEITSILYDQELIQELKNDFTNDLKDSTTHLPPR